MTVIKLSGDYIKQGYTQVDNIFITDFLPGANGDDVRIYLYGLSLVTSNFHGDFIAKIASTLKTTEQRVREGFAYWDKQGIVEVRGTDMISYLSVKTPVTPIVKFNAQKYKVFTEETVRIFPDKIFTPNEYNRYFEFMSSRGMEVNAMLLIMQYCKDMGGGRTSTDYVLAVANAWADDGLLKEKQIIERIDEMETGSEDLKTVFKALGVKRAPDVEDRQLFATWTKNYGYTLDAILTAARTLKKRGGMEKLDAYIKELNTAQAMSANEIAEYTKNKENIRQLCITLCKNIGVYYGSTDSIEEIYVRPWISLGFDKDALEQISKYCFLRNARDFESMQQMVQKFAKQGIFTADAIAVYVARQVKLDEKIRAVYEKCGYIGTIGNKDRDNYRMWEEWGFDEKIIFVVAEHYGNKVFPMASINRTLGQLHNNKIFDVAGAISFIENDKQGTTKQHADTYMEHQYTKEQLKQAFVNFDNWD